jgi:YfiH family protein
VTDCEFIVPDWNAPGTVRAAVTTRAGGVSKGGWAGCNIAQHVADDPDDVRRNRTQVAAQLNLPGEPRWLDQVHGTISVCADAVAAPVPADAVWTATPGVVCAIMTADCLPVLLCDRNGTRVAAVHAGWRGLCAGVLDACLAGFVAAGIATQDVLVWLGPAIGPAAYEIDNHVRDAFLERSPELAQSFVATRPGHWSLDMYAAARHLLAATGVVSISGGELCTFTDERFFSYRREPECGRFASLIWLDGTASTKNAPDDVDIFDEPD